MCQNILEKHSADYSLDPILNHSNVSNTAVLYVAPSMVWLTAVNPQSWDDLSYDLRPLISTNTDNNVNHILPAFFSPCDLQTRSWSRRHFFLRHATLTLLTSSSAPRFAMASKPDVKWHESESELESYLRLQVIFFLTGLLESSDMLFFYHRLVQKHSCHVCFHWISAMLPSL